MPATGDELEAVSSALAARAEALIRSSDDVLSLLGIRVSHYVLRDEKPGFSPGVELVDRGGAWAIVKSGACLNTDGEWEHEALPSSRDAAFTGRCRWPTPAEAMRHWLRSPQRAAP
jgi:hypothetical protein